MSLLDDVMPEYEFTQRVAIRIHMPPAHMFRALEEITLDEPFIAQLLRGGNVVLAERPGKEIVIGAIGKFHQVLDREPVMLRDAEHFRTFDDPAYQKIAIALRIERPHHHRRIALEARTHALSVESKQAFARYWIVIKPMGSFVSWLLLRAARRRAARHHAH